MNDFTTTFTVPQSPAAVFDAINDVRAWWGGHIEGDTDKLGDVFVYEHLPEHRSVQRITESTPGERIVWHIDEAHLRFVEDGDEWTDTEVVFDLEPADGGTRLTFTHRGLVPDFECYDACSSAWSMYINGALRQFIEGREADYRTAWAHFEQRQRAH